jgi:uncharacterized protein (TIGR02266 family)
MLGKTTATNIQRPPDTEAPVSSYRVALSTVLRFAGRDRPRTATAASLGGIFVESPDALAIGELVLALISLGAGQGELRALMTVERVVLPAESAFCGGLPGMGLRFFLTDDALRTRWENHMKALEANHAPRIVDPRAIEHRPGPLVLPGGPRRNASRRQARFRVRLAKSELASFYTRNISKGGMFIATTEIQPRGSEIQLDVRHPITRQVFQIVAEVRWVAKDGPNEEWGMGVAFQPPEDGAEEAFLQFVNAG